MSENRHKKINEVLRKHQYQEFEPMQKAEKHTHNVWHITEPTGERISRAHANVSAKNSEDAVGVARKKFPHLKDRDLHANIVSSTAHTPPNWPASHHYEFERQK